MCATAFKAEQLSGALAGVIEDLANAPDTDTPLLSHDLLHRAGLTHLALIHTQGEGTQQGPAEGAPMQPALPLDPHPGPGAADETLAGSVNHSQPQSGS
jgi:hypothetical protein